MWQSLLDLEGFMWEGKPILVGANEENKQLDESLKQKKMKVQELKGILEKESERGKQMHSHYSDVMQEKNYVEQLKNAKRHEFDIQENNQKLVSRERSHLMQEIHDMKKEIELLKLRQKMREANISEQMEKCEALKSAIHLEEEALMKWLKESAEMERDKIALVKYTHQDDSKMKELNLLLERLGKEAKNRKVALDEADTELFITQSELDRIQEEFQKAHNERQEIISNWEKVLLQLQNRNEEIDQLSKYIASMQEEEKALNQKLSEQKQLLAAEIANNKHIERKIAEQESYATKLRMKLNEETKREADLQAEMESLRNVSTFLEYKVQNTQNNIRKLDELLNERYHKLKEAEKAQASLQKEIDTLAKETFDADHYTQELEKLLKKEKNRLNKVQSEFTALQNSVLKFIQKLKDMVANEKAMESQVKGTQVSSRNLSNTITKLDHDRLEQQKLMAGINMCIKQTEQRIKLMEGELTNDEERWQMGREKERLQTILDEKNSSLAFLNQQVKSMMEKINVSVKTLDCSKKQNNELAEKIDFLEYYITNSQKTLKHLCEKKEGFLVDECMAKLQLSRYKDLLRQRNETVKDLQRNQVEFETVMKERILELKSCKDMVQIEVRKEEEECYQTKRQLQECSDKVAKLQSRYDVILNALGLTEAGENLQVNLMVKAEDEKRALQQERDELVSKVIQNEEDLHALRNTYWVIQATNVQFRQLLNPPGLTTEENESLRKLEKEQQSLDIEMHSCLQRQQDLDKNIAKSEETLRQMQEKKLDVEKTLAEKKIATESLCKEIADIETKLSRADKSNSKIAVDIFQNLDESAFELDIKIHLLRELRKAVADQLFSAVVKYPDIAAQIKTMFEEAQLPLPPRARSSFSSRSSWSSASLSQLLQKQKCLPSSDASTTPESSHSSRKSEKSVLTPTIVSLGCDLPDQKSSGTTLLKSSSSIKSKQ